MAGFSMKNGKVSMKPTTPAANQQQDATFTNSFRDGDSDKWDISIKNAKYSKSGGQIGLKLKSFNFKDFKAINQVNPNLFFVKDSTEKTLDKKYNEVYLWIKLDRIDEFFQELPKLEAFLESTNHYSEGSIKDFGNKIKKFIDNTPTPAEVEANDKNIANNWRELLETMQNPEVQKRFLAFQTSYVCALNDDLKDLILSPGNIISVLTADPQASFVTDRNTWETKYGHRIKDNAPFVIITKPENSIPPQRQLESDPIVRANGGWNALVRKSGGPWYGAAFAAIKRVNVKYGNQTKYYQTKVYDVRFTEPFDPAHDKFLEVVNLINNLTGELNDIAKKAYIDTAIANGEQAPDVNKKKVGLEGDAELQAFKKFILNKCKSLKVQVPEVGSDEDIITNAIYAYAYQYAESLNMLTDKVRQAFANAVCFAVASTYNIQSNKVSSAANYFSKLNQDEAESMITASFGLYKQLASFSVRRESIETDPHIMSFDEYRDLILSKTKNKSTMKSKFDNIMSRMDNSPR